MYIDLILHILYIYIHQNQTIFQHQDDSPGRRVLTGTLAGEMTIWNGALAPNFFVQLFGGTKGWEMDKKYDIP